MDAARWPDPVCTAAGARVWGASAGHSSSGSCRPDMEGQAEAGAEAEAEAVGEEAEAGLGTGAKTGERSGTRSAATSCVAGSGSRESATEGGSRRSVAVWCGRRSVTARSSRVSAARPFDSAAAGFGGRFVRAGGVRSLWRCGGDSDVGASGGDRVTADGGPGTAGERGGDARGEDAKGLLGRDTPIAAGWGIAPSTTWHTPPPGAAWARAGRYSFSACCGWCLCGAYGDSGGLVMGEESTLFSASVSWWIPTSGVGAAACEVSIPAGS